MISAERRMAMATRTSGPTPSSTRRWAQAVGLAVEFAMQAQPLLAEQHRNRLRRSTRLLRDQLVDERPARIVLTGLVPARQQQVPLGTIQ